MINAAIARVCTAGAVVMASVGVGTASADPSPGNPAPRPIPGNVWMSPGSVPMDDVYHWAPANPTATARASFLSTRLCGAPAADLLPPSSAISTQTPSGSAASVVQSVGQWPEPAPVGSDRAVAFQSGIRSQLNFCAGINQVQSVDLRPAPSWFGFAGTLRIGERDNQTSEVHLYNVVPPGSSAISELAVTVPLSPGQPSPWKLVDDVAMLRALAAPWCATAC